MHITVLGSNGRIGKVMVRMITDSGHTVSGIDQENREDLGETLERSDAVLLALPVHQALKFMESTKFEGTIVEVCSVKSPLLAYSGRIVSIHPLFGPMSLPENQTICHVWDISLPESARIVEQLFPNCLILDMTIEEHERLMLTSLVAPYLLSLLSRELGKDSLVLTRSANLMKAMAGILDSENRSVVLDTIRLNPNTPQLLEEIVSFIRSFMEVAH